MRKATRQDVLDALTKQVEAHGHMPMKAWESLFRVIAHNRLVETVDEHRFRPLIVDVVAGRLVVLDELAPTYRQPRARPGLKRCI